jgi:hypothetical protein
MHAIDSPRATRNHPPMANLSAEEFTAAVGALADQLGIERLRERLARMNAFTSRRGLNSPAAIADRLYALSGGLRRQVVSTFAFTSLWQEVVGGRIGEEGEKKLGEIADKVNACLAPDESIVPGKEAELDEALAAYRDALATSTGPLVARLDMLMKAVPAVAERLRAAPLEPSAPAAEG